MAESYEVVRLFWESKDLHAEFLGRVAVAIQEWAIDQRVETPPDPVTAEWFALETWAVWALKNPDSAAEQILPALAIKANENDLIGSDGSISATDNQIKNTINDTFIAMYAGYIPPVP